MPSLLHNGIPILLSAIGSGLLALVLFKSGMRFWHSLLVVIAVQILHLAYLLIVIQ